MPWFLVSFISQVVNLQTLFLSRQVKKGESVNTGGIHCSEIGWKLELSLDNTFYYYYFARMFIYWKPSLDTYFEHLICFLLVLIIKVICSRSSIFADMVNFEKQNISIAWHKTKISTINSSFWEHIRKASKNRSYKVFLAIHFKDNKIL